MLKYLKPLTYFLFVAFFSACAVEEDNTPDNDMEPEDEVQPTNWIITVLHEENPVQGVSVSIYNTLQDLQNLENSILSAQSDNDGKVSFSELSDSDTIYFLRAVKGNLKYMDYESSFSLQSMMDNMHTINLSEEEIDTTVVNTILSLHIIKEGMAEPGVEVVLYRTNQDLQNGANPINSDQTDGDGNVVFSGLQAFSEVYAYAFKDNFDNKDSASAITITPEITNYDTLEIFEKAEKLARVVLLEEFTGQSCPNCPSAHALTANLLDDYPEQLVAVSIQAGPLAGALEIPDGSDIYSLFNVSSQPQGMINRAVFDRNREWHGTGFWRGFVEEEIAKDAGVAIEAEIDYNASTRGLNIQGKATLLNDFADDLKITVMLTESGIVAPQSNGGSDYVHNHVLRDVVTDFSGDLIEIGNFTDDEATFNLNTTLANEWEESNMKVVVFIHEFENSDYVLQAFEAPVL